MNDMSKINLPALIVEEGVAYVDSRDLAKAFGREHRTVLDSIREAHCTHAFAQQNFLPVTKKQRRNSKLEEITLYTMMTFDGFSFVAMGWTGAKAGQFKEAYIAKFNDMRRVLEAEAGGVEVASPSGVSDAVAASLGAVAFAPPRPPRLTARSSRSLPRGAAVGSVEFTAPFLSEP